MWNSKKARTAGAQSGREQVKAMGLEGEERPDPTELHGPMVRTLNFILSVMGDS